MQAQEGLCNHTNHDCIMIKGLHLRRDYMMFALVSLLLLVSGASALELEVDAGEDQTVWSGTSVTLDGSGSTGTNLTYEWVENSAVLSNQASFSREFSIGMHEITLTVSDGIDTDTDNVAVEVKNRPPVADAGKDRVVSPNTYVKLDASGSSDPDGSIDSYVWGEDGEELSTRKSFNKVFDIGKHEITLTVTDDFGDTGDDTIEIVVNRAPIADAGPDRAVSEGTIVHFDASNSSDLDGDSLSYKWTEDGVTGDLNAAPSFEMAFPCGMHCITLEVTDEYGATATDRVVIEVSPLDQKPPIADAGPDRTVLVGTNITLDASNSTDPDGTIVKYEWFEAYTVISESVVFEHIFPRGVNHVTLVVTDDGGASGTADVTITVRSSMNMPEADAGADREALAGTEIILDASRSGGENLTYQWLLNGTILSDERMFYHLFDPGTYIVMLIVADEYEYTDTDEINIVITTPAAVGEANRVSMTPEAPETRGLGYYLLVAIAIILVLGSIVFIRSRSHKSSKSLKSPKPTKSSSASGYGGHQHTKPEPAGEITDDKPVKPETKPHVRITPPEPKPVQLRVKVLDSASKTPIPGVAVHAGQKTRKTDEAGEGVFTLDRGKELMIKTSGIPNLYGDGSATASADSVDGGVATILLPSIVSPDQEQDARLRAVRGAFENRYREVSGYDRCIPGFYRSVAQRLIEYVRGITAVHFLCGKHGPKDVMDRLVSVIEVVCTELSEVMVSKRGIDLYAAGGTGTENASGCTASLISHDSLTDLISDPAGFASKTSQGVQQLLSDTDKEITSRTRDMSVLPITGIWSIAKELLSDQSGDDIECAMRILVADILLRYAREMYENPEIVKRMKRGIL